MVFHGSFESTYNIDTAQMLLIWGVNTKFEVINESAYMNIICGQARTLSKKIWIQHNLKKNPLRYIATDGDKNVYAVDKEKNWT